MPAMPKIDLTDDERAALAGVGGFILVASLYCGHAAARARITHLMANFRFVAGVVR